MQIEDIAEVIASAIKEATAPLIAENKALEARLSALEARPLPERGEKGEAGSQGPEGPAGAGIADLLIDNEGALVATFTDGRMKTLGPVVGKDGRDGVDGRDGKDGAPGADGKDGEAFTLDDFDIEITDERTIEMRFDKGRERHSFELVFPFMIYRGVYSEGREYAIGDVVTWGGSAWYCEEPKGLKPDGPDSGWRLMVKRGRDGRDAK